MSYFLFPSSFPSWSRHKTRTWEGKQGACNTLDWLWTDMYLSMYVHLSERDHDPFKSR